MTATKAQGREGLKGVAEGVYSSIDEKILSLRGNQVVYRVAKAVPIFKIPSNLLNRVEKEIW